MEGMLSIFRSISESQCNDCMFMMLDEHQTFRNQAPQELDLVVSHISNLFNDMSTKGEAVEILYTFVQQCPLDIFEQKGALWIALTTKICAQQKPPKLVSIAYNLLGMLLQRSIHIPELTKAISNNLLSKIIECTRVVPGSAHYNALGCLSVAMKLYPGAAGITKTTTEKFILSFIDSSDEVLVRKAGVCLLLLQQTRGGGTHSAAHKEAWKQLQISLIGSLHELLDAIYSNTSETSDGFLGNERLLLPDMQLCDEPVSRMEQLVRRFKNLVNCLQVALLDPFPVAKSIQPAKILALISRGLAVNCATLATNLIMDNIIVGALVPVIHVAMFRLLDALTLVLKTNLLPYSRQVRQLIVQSLKWTSSGRSIGAKRPYTSIRRSAYRSLTHWCMTMSYGSGVEQCADDLSAQILQDITPFVHEVTLKVLSGAKKHLSKKARKSLHKAQNDATNMAQTHSKAFNPHNTKIVYTDEGNETLCIEALRSLTQMLNVSGSFLKPVMHKLLQEHLIRIALSVAQAPILKNHLYAAPSGRISLYETIFALVAGAHALCPPPLQFASKLFAIGMVRDSNPRVRERCAELSRNLETYMHPIRQTLHFMTELSEMRDALKDLRSQNPATSTDVEEDDDDEELLLNDETSTDQRISDATIDLPKSGDKGCENIELNESSDDEIVVKPTSSPVEVVNLDTDKDQSPIVICTEDLADDDTLAMSDDDESKSGSKIDLSKSIETIDVDNHEENLAPLPLSRPDLKRRSLRTANEQTKETIDISDDEKPGDSESGITPKKRVKTSTIDDDEVIEIRGDEDDMVDNVLATFIDEINSDFVLL